MECERTDSPLRQGDIVAAHPKTDGWLNPWTRMGVILTADCDIDKGKSGPGLVYLPIVSHRTYLADIWLPDEASELAAKARASINKQLGSLDAKLADRHIDAWGRSGGIEKIAQELGDRINGKADSPGLSKVNSRILKLWEAVNSFSTLSQRVNPTQTDQLDVLIKNLVESKRVLESSTVDPNYLGRQAVQAALESAQSRLDMWLISELIGLDPDMMQNADYGYVVSLRSFSLIPISSIEVDKVKWFSSPEKYLRICRLRGIYKTDLLQHFANMFTRVGLEDSRVDHHRMLFQRSANSLFPGEVK